MSKASKIYNSLTRQQQDFVQQKNISATFKIGKWIGFLGKVSHFDALSDKRIKKIQGFAILFIVLAFISIFAGAISEVGYVFLGIPIFAVLSIVLFIRVRKLKKMDVNNYLRLFFLPALNVLKDKAGEDTKLAASLDFRDPRKANDPEKSKVNGRNLKLYKPTYIIAKVVLSDKTTLEFVVSDDVKDFTWTKRSSSGKLKSKSKTKYTHHCFIKMTLDKSEYSYEGKTSPSVDIVDHNGSYIAKTKVKIKTLGRENVLKVGAFFASVQSVYALFTPLNPSANAPHRSDDDSDDEFEYDESYSAVPYIWYASTFDDHDYDSFDYSDSGDMMMEDDGASVFDS